MGLACHIAKIHSEASVKHNTWELRQYTEELYWGSGLALVQSPYGGTPIASDILLEGQIADLETRRIREFLICKLIKGDIRALEDLTYEKRKEFIKSHELPKNIPLISFHSEASVAPGVIATVSYIAHTELSPGFLDLARCRRCSHSSTKSACNSPCFCCHGSLCPPSTTKIWGEERRTYNMSRC